MMHLPYGSSVIDEAPSASAEARESAHYIRPGQVSFEERGYKLAILAVESFGCHGKSGSQTLDTPARSVIKWTDSDKCAQGGSG